MDLINAPTVMTLRLFFGLYNHSTSHIGLRCSSKHVQTICVGKIKHPNHSQVRELHVSLYKNKQQEGRYNGLIAFFVFVHNSMLKRYTHLYIKSKGIFCLLLMITLKQEMYK